MYIADKMSVNLCDVDRWGHEPTGSELIRAFTSLFLAGALACNAQQPSHRVVILQIDGLNADLLYRNMREEDPATGKPRLPWFAHVFSDNGAVFENFYTRGISLSAPS